MTDPQRPVSQTTRSDVRTMDIEVRIRHHGEHMGGLTGELFRLAAEEIARLRDELAAANTECIRLETELCK